jgi:hypothetical protein
MHILVPKALVFSSSLNSLSTPGSFQKKMGTALVVARGYSGRMETKQI